MLLLKWFLFKPSVINSCNADIVFKPNVINSGMQIKHSTTNIQMNPENEIISIFGKMRKRSLI